MNKRPLCLLCICVMAGIWLIDILGISKLWDSPEHDILHEYAKNEASCSVYGQVSKYETKTNSIYIYLENANLIVHSEQYSLKQIIIKNRGSETVAVGNVLCVNGELENIPEATNPGQFDTRDYYHARNIDFFVKAEKITVSDETKDWIRESLLKLRNSFRWNYEQSIPSEAGALSAILLGDKTLLEEEQKVRYQMSGITHILAISGLHLSLLGMGLYRLLLKLRLSHAVAGSLSVLLLLGYAILTGESVSTMRALIMFVLTVGARFAGRTYDLLSALALSAILILLEYPGYLYYSGFLLSFTAVLGIGAVFPILQNKAKRSEKKEKGVERMKMQIGGGLLSGMAVWITTLPIVLYYFYEISLYGILLNLLVIPTLTAVLLSGILGGIFGFFNLTVGKIALVPAQILLNMYERIGRIIQNLPFPTLILGKPHMWQVVVYYVLFFLILLVWKRNKKSGSGRWISRLALSASVCGLIVVLSFHPRKGLSITALDVGQGDSLVISTEKGNHYLVDGGSSSVNRVGTYRMIPFLKSQGVRKVDAVLVTHPDNDHINGILELFEVISTHQTSLRVGQCILPAWMAATDDGGLKEAAKEAGIPVCYVRSGDRIQDGEIQFQILHPDDRNYTENPNAGSLTFVLQYGGFRGLFTGDLCEEGEEAVQEQVGECDFLKVAHHGSGYSTEMDFLEKVKPKISVISCGKNNLYGHPHPELLKRLETIKSGIYQTMQDGAVTVWTDGVSEIHIEQFCALGNASSMVLSATYK